METSISKTHHARGISRTRIARLSQNRTLQAFSTTAIRIRLHALLATTAWEGRLSPGNVIAQQVPMQHACVLRQFHPCARIALAEPTQMGQIVYPSAPAAPRVCQANMRRWHATRRLIPSASRVLTRSRIQLPTGLPPAPSAACVQLGSTGKALAA